MSKAKRAKRANRPNPRIDRNDRNNIIELQNVRRSRKKKIHLIPRNVAQEEYVDALLDDSLPIVIASGPAGCGKTLLATLAAIKAYNEGKCDKIVITRPNRAVDDKDIGYLPGDIFSKMMPWTLPILDVFKEYYSPREVELLLEEEILEVCPIAFIRGRTFKNSWVLVDEAQGTTKNSMLSILTRIGENSKMVVTGDTRQSDIGRNNGLQDFLDRFNHSDLIRTIGFHREDVERHPAVSEVLKIYGED